MRQCYSKKVKSLVFVLLAGVMIVGMMPSTVNAATKYSYTITRSSGFTSAWSVSATVNISAEGVVYPAKITYGYDTWCTKEDYVTKVGGMPTGCKCQGTVINSKGTTKTTKTIKAGKLSGKVDVKHTGKAKYRVTMWFG